MLQTKTLFISLFGFGFRAFSYDTPAVISSFFCAGSTGSDHNDGRRNAPMQQPMNWAPKATALDSGFTFR
jgi:hypothetical protein